MNSIVPTIEIDNIASPVVPSKDGDVFAKSRDVAAFFGKRHDNVMRDIAALKLTAPERVLKFEEPPYVNHQNGETYRSLDMTRDGFTLLAMGFSGKRTIKFKLAYIEAFNRMEAEMMRVAPTLPDFNDPAAAVEAWAVSMP